MLYSGILKKSSTIVWNGACGYMEVAPYDTGTIAMARVIATVSRGDCFGIKSVMMRIMMDFLRLFHGFICGVVFW
jgi:3-phosphoglycerate kinase